MALEQINIVGSVVEKAPPVRILTLDMMRGLAALTVGLYHLNSWKSVAPRGYLAVDFFFILSGFVLCSAYEVKLNNNLSPVKFVMDRFIRLYPMYLLGMLFGLVQAMAVVLFLPEQANSFYKILWNFVNMLFMLPVISDNALFPLNYPAWSLFFELLVNVAFGICLCKLRSTSLLCLTVTVGIILCIYISASGSVNFGGEWVQFTKGCARVTFSFSAGILISRFSIQIYHTKFLFLVPPVCLILCLSYPVLNNHSEALIDSVFVFLLSPALLIGGVRWQPVSYWRKVCTALGNVSYPFYAIHFPLLYILGVAARRFGVPSAWSGMVSMGIILVIAYFSASFLDPKFRQRLGRFHR